MADLSTYIIYFGLLASIIALLCSKNTVFVKPGDGLIENKNEIRVQDILVLLLLTVIVGFRYEVGVDWSAYRAYFEEFDLYKNLSYEDQRMEIGYYWINAFVNLIGGNYTLVFAITAVISWTFILKSFPTKLLPLTFFFIFCDGYFFWSMNGVRQFIAIAIFVYSLKFIIHQDLKRYLFFIVLASFFHQSALLLLPLFFIPFNRLYNQNFWFIAFIASLVFSKTPFVISGFQNLYTTIAFYIPFMAEYNSYFDSQYFEAGQISGTGLGYLFRILISLFLLVFSKRIIDKFPETKIYFILFFVGIILFNLFFMFQIIGRFAHYFIIFRAYLLAVFILFLFKNKKYSYIGVGIIFLYFFFFINIIYQSANACCPYKFVIN